MEKSIAEAVERSIWGALGFTSTVAAEPSEPLTLDKMLADMKALMNSVPPPPVFASSVGYPRDGFWTFERDGREYILSHPDLWGEVPAERASPAAFNLSAYSSIPIHDCDHPVNRELAGKIWFWVATASHRPGEPPKWPKGVRVERRTIPIHP